MPCDIEEKDTDTFPFRNGIVQRALVSSSDTVPIDTTYVLRKLFSI